MRVASRSVTASGPPVRANSSPAATRPSRTAPRGRRPRGRWRVCPTDRLGVSDHSVIDCGQRPLLLIVDSVHLFEGRHAMKESTTTRSSRVTAAEWFAGGQRVPYDPGSARVQTEEEAAAMLGGLRVFERVAPGEETAEDTVWLTMLPGFPDGSYGRAQVDRLLSDRLSPRLYVEPIGQGDSDKPRKYRYSTMERADLVHALWGHHGVRRTVVVTFDYTSLALLELLRRQLEGSMSWPQIPAVLMV